MTTTLPTGQALDDDHSWLLDGGDGSWADSIRLGKTGARTARQRFGPDADWVRRWTLYAQVLGELRGSGDLQNNRTAAERDVLEAVGSPAVLLHGLLDVSRTGYGEMMGRKLIEDVFLPALKALHNSHGPGTPREVAEPIAAWLYVIESRELSRAAHQFGTDYNYPKHGARQALLYRLWADGLLDPTRFPAGFVDGLRDLTREIDRKLEPLLRDRERPPGRPGETSVDHYLDLLLPRDVADKLRVGVEKLKTKLPAGGHADLGIDEHGHTELLIKALPQLLKRIANRQSMLLLGPTSSGKSHVGRIAVAYAVRHRPGSRAVILLPTKALVTQAVQEWEEFKADTQLAGWRILAGSRDYPENDDALIRGAFEIAVLIPEKLSALMAAGMQLRGCTLLVVDELQHLSEEQRGPRLEMLLTTVRNLHPEIPLLGLSATLTNESTETVRRWLKIDESAVIRATKRPVPLDQHACDDRCLRGLSAEGKRIEEPLDLSSILDRWHQPTSGMKTALDPVHYWERSLALAIKLLREGERSVLCFVGSRNQAELMADAAREALQREPGLPRLDFSIQNPFLGRYQPLEQPLTPDEAKRRWSQFKRFPKTPLRDSVEEAVRSGVGYHTARLEQSLRTVVETAFREGQIRLLFSTDTLKLGLNLPADAVIVSSLTTPVGGGRQRVLNRDDVAQRLGRAGRLNYSTRGRGYLVVPHKPPRRTDLRWDDFDLAGLAARVPETHPDEAPIDRAVRALCDVDAVCDHYLVAGPMDVGTGITASLDNEWFASLLLQAMVRNSPTCTIDDLKRRVDGLYQVSMGAVAGIERPDPATVVRLLEKQQLIGRSSRVPGSFTITGLGRALSASGLPFEDADMVQRVAQAALDGAGTMTLLWMATNTQHVSRSNDWISLNTLEDDDLTIDRLQLRMLDVARAFAAPPSERQKYADSLHDGKFVESLPREDLVGSGEDAEELRTFVIGPALNPGPEQFTALLRTCVLTMWMHGCPLAALAQAIRKNVRAYADRESDIHIHDADVRALGENASYVFDAAGELLGVRPEGTAFRRLQAIGDAVQFGVPQALTPLVRLPLQATHRERIVQLVRHVDGRDFDSLADLVDTYMSLPRNAPRNPLIREQMKDANLTDSERAVVRDKLEQYEARRRGRVARLPGEYRSVNVPGLGQDFGVIADDLCSPGLENPPAKFALVLRACGITVTQESRGLLLTSAVDASIAVRMAIHTDRVTARDLDPKGNAPDIMVALGGIAAGAAVTGTSPDRQMSPTVVVEPATLLETIARVIALEKPGWLRGDYEEVNIAEESDTASDEELYDWDDDIEDEQVAGYGLQGVGVEVLRVLRAAPPVLTRNDLNRLIAGLTVAAPPPLARNAAAEEVAASLAIAT